MFIDNQQSSDCKKEKHAMNKKLKENLKLIAIAEDKATNEFFAVVRYRDVKGDFRNKEVPLAALDDASGLRKELINAGAYFASDAVDPLSGIRVLQAAKEQAPQWVYAKQLGWEGGLFVRAKGVVGKQNQDSLLKPPRALHPVAKKMGKGGTLDGWRQSIAGPAAHSSRVVTAICAAFAAPLLKFAGVGSFALFFTGPSKVGKSTLTLAAGSAIGFKSENSLPNFRSTDAALGELPGQFNDHMVPLNELGLMRGTSRERRQRQRELAFGAAEGHSTTYSRLSPASNTGQDEYRSILVANGEETSDELAMRAGEFRLAGECHRWIDVPALERASPDIFDLAPALDIAKRAVWFSTTCAAMRKGCRLHHGVAIRHFVGEFAAQKKKVRAELHKLRGSFVDAVAQGETDHVVLHMAKNFGHLYAAGVLAVRFKTVPWSEELVLKCIRACYTAARREIKTEAELLRRSLLRLNAKAQKQTILMNKNSKVKSLKDVDGYRRKEGQKIVLTVRAMAFKNWFADQRQPRLVLESLQKQGRLGGCGTPQRGQGIVWAERQVNWPDGTRARSIVITLADKRLLRK
jgi:hypothetical protein